jgi:hypothetical protein
VITVDELAGIPLFFALAERERKYLAGSVEDIGLVPGEYMARLAGEFGGEIPMTLGTPWAAGIGASRASSSRQLRGNTGGAGRPFAVSVTSSATARFCGRSVRAITRSRITSAIWPSTPRRASARRARSSTAPTTSACAGCSRRSSSSVAGRSPDPGRSSVSSRPACLSASAASSRATCPCGALLRPEHAGDRARRPAWGRRLPARRSHRRRRRGDPPLGGEARALTRQPAGRLTGGDPAGAVRASCPHGLGSGVGEQSGSRGGWAWLRAAPHWWSERPVHSGA